MVLGSTPGTAFHCIREGAMKVVVTVIGGHVCSGVSAAGGLGLDLRTYDGCNVGRAPVLYRVVNCD
jgi:hypothetical protein